MEQTLFSTAQIAAELEHKSKNPRRDVLNIAKRLGFSPVATRPREGKNPGGKPEMLWSKEQHDAILDYNRKRYNDGNIQDARADVTDTASNTATVTPSTAQANDDEIIATPTEQAITDVSIVEEPAPVVITLDERANRIRALQADVQRGIIEIGNELLAAKKEVGHGNWSAWLKKEFSWSDRTARRFMAVAERFGKMDNVVRFQPSTLQEMLLLPEGTEQEFIDEQANSGKPVELQSAREIQRNVKAFKTAHATPKETAEEPTPDLSNRGETFSLFGRKTDAVTHDSEVVSEPVAKDSAKQEETAADDTAPTTKTVDEPVTNEFKLAAIKTFETWLNYIEVIGSTISETQLNSLLKLCGEYWRELEKQFTYEKKLARIAEHILKSVKEICAQNSELAVKIKLSCAEPEQAQENQKNKHYE